MSDKPLHSTPLEDPLRLISRGLTKLFSWWVGLTYPFAGRGCRLSVHYTCDLPRPKAHRVKLGNSVLMMKDAVIDVVAPDGQDGEPAVIVDDDTQIGYRCLVSAKNCIHIERDVIMAQSVLIMDHDDAPRGLTPGGRILIGQGSWIGQGAAIICTAGELVLGRNCVVGANAVVTRSFPPNSVVFGNPARVIKQFDQTKDAWVLGSILGVESGAAK